MSEDDDKDRYPLWPARKIWPLPKIAAWMVIGGGAYMVLFNLLFFLVMNWGFGVPLPEPEPLWSYAIGAIMGGMAFGGSCLWNMKRRCWATLVIGVGLAMLIGLWP